MMMTHSTDADHKKLAAKALYAKYKSREFFAQRISFLSEFLSLSPNLFYSNFKCWPVARTGEAL